MRPWTTTRPRRLLPAVVAVLALALSALVVARATGDSSAGCETKRRAAAERRAITTGYGAAVVVIGDSYAVGAGAGPWRSWPTRLPGRVHVDAFSGSGFSAGASECGPVSYADRAPRALAGRSGAFVVVEGGLNDTDQPLADLERGFADLVDALAGHPVLVVGPPAAPDRADDVPAVDDALRRLSDAAGYDYLSMTEVALTYTDDDLHPDLAGHRAFGDAVAAHLARR